MTKYTVSDTWDDLLFPAAIITIVILWFVFLILLGSGVFGPEGKASSPCFYRVGKATEHIVCPSPIVRTS